MGIKKLIGSVFKTILTLIIFAAIMYAVYYYAAKAYDFGYRIFAEDAMSPEPGITMTVAIVEGKTVREIGESLEEKGLVRDATLFYFQELVSNYHGKLQPGIYELNTSMTPEEMMEIMSVAPEEDETAAETAISSDTGTEAESWEGSEESASPEEETDSDESGESTTAE